jgi:nucleoporin NUP159
VSLVLFLFPFDVIVLTFAVSSIAWLENDIFFVAYTPNSAEEDMSSYYIITRRKQAPFLIQKLPEVCPTMGFQMRHTPAYQFVARLRDYKPHLKDALILSSTRSPDLSIIVRSEQSLSSDDPSLANQFAVVDFSDDTKRASVPLQDDDGETSVVGLVPDLSSNQNVVMPIQGADITESSTPVPGIFLLNNEGILSSWWLIYNDAIHQQVAYSGLVSAGSAPQAPSQPQQPAFGQSSFGGGSAFSASTFGKPSGGPAFGSPSSMGGSTMGATAFGKPSGPSFGSPSPLGGGSGPTFGTPSAPGPSFGTPSQPAFGQSGFGTMASPFGKSSTPGKSLLGTADGSSGGGFSSFSGGGGGGFAGFASAKSGDSPFSKPSTGESAFSKPAAASPFGAPSQTTSAFSPKPAEVKNPFGAGSGFGSSGFVLGSSFKGDGTAVNDEPKPDKPSSGPFSFGNSFDEMISSSSKTSPQAESMDDAEDAGVPEQPAQTEPKSIFGAPSKPEEPPKSQPTSVFGAPSRLEQPAKTEPKSLFGAPSKPEEPAKSETTSMFGAPSKPATPPTSLFGKPSEPARPNPFAQPTESGFSFGERKQSETKQSSFSLFGNTTTTTSQTSSQNQVTSPLSAPSDKTATPKRRESVTTPTFPSIEAPLPPDSTSRDPYAAGDTSASSNVSKSSIEDAPLPPDFISTKKPSTKENDAPLPPDFLSQKKPTPKVDDAPLPPDFVTKPKKEESPPPVPEEAPLPPDFTTSKAKAEPAEEAVPVPDGSDADSEEEADESDFSDSGEEITHDETKIPSPKPSAESSFGGSFEKSSTGGLFSGISKTAPKQEHPPRQLFGEIPKQPLLPPGPAAQSGREPFRSPSPTRVGSQKNLLFSDRNESRPEAGSALTSRKASLTQVAQREGQLRKPSDTARQEQARGQAVAQRQEEEEALSLSDDDEDERLRADLARPVEPVSTLDPFLPHQNYMGETAKPGIAGMIERLYRDINSMVDTLGINARSLESFLLYQQTSETSDVDDWVHILKSDQPADILDEKIFLQDIGKLDYLVVTLNRFLDEKRVQGVEEKLEQCRELLRKDIVTLRGQCASIRKTLDAHTDTGSILTAPLSAEQAALQHDLRTAFTQIQASMADLEQGVSLLRAKIADIPRPDGSGSGRKRPTVEAVSSTIATMMSMAEGKSSDIDVLEAQMRKLGIDLNSSSASVVSREGSPFTTPRKNAALIPATPGSRGSIDGSAYHTPESASRGVNFRASVNGSAKHSRLRSVELPGSVAAEKEIAKWKSKSARRQHLVKNLKEAIEKKQTKVRGVDW